MHTYVPLVVLLNFFSRGEGKELTCYEGATQNGTLSLGKTTWSGEGLHCVTRYMVRTDPITKQPLEDITTYEIMRIFIAKEGCYSPEKQVSTDVYVIKECWCITDLCNKPDGKTLTCAVGESTDGFDLRTLPQTENGSLACLTYIKRFIDGRKPNTLTDYAMGYLNTSSLPEQCFPFEKISNYFLRTCKCSQDKCNVPGNAFYSKPSTGTRHRK